MAESFREKTARRARSEEERALLRRMCDLAERADRTGAPTSSRFLTPAEQAVCELGRPFYPSALAFEGGFDGAERAVAIFIPFGGDAPPRGAPDFPIAAVKLAHSRPLGHRDLLGAAMSLGLERAQIGDIVAGESESVILCLRPNLEFLLSSLTRAGKLPLETSELPLAELVPPERKTERRTVTVASPRLDAVLAAGFGLSREDARSAVRRGLVSLNHRVEEKPDRELHEGDLLSMRGGGRFILAEFAGESRRGRLRISIEKFV